MEMTAAHYRHLVVMTALSFIVMYLLMYAMVNALPNVYVNVNEAYMAGLMAAPMPAFEVLLMRSMYSDRRRNRITIAVSALLLIVCWQAIRHQIAVTDHEFLRSMIPHHAGAILMCENARISDPRIEDLCGRIVASQQAEIAEMKEILNSGRR